MLIQKKMFSLVVLLVWTSICHASLIKASDTLPYQTFKTPAKQTVHVLTVDPKRFEIRLTHADNTALGRATLSDIAKKHRATAAINGGFFKIGAKIDGLPAGILKIQGQWYGIAYRDRAALGWSTRNPLTLMDRVQTKTQVYLNHQASRVQLLNQPPSQTRAVLYTDAYPANVDLAPDTYGLRIQNQQLTSIQSAGPMQNQKGSYRYSLPKHKVPTHPVEVGHPATVSIEVIPHFLKENYLAWQSVDNILGGAPLLITRGRVIKDYSGEKVLSSFIKERYARTAVGIRKNGDWVLVVVEQSALSNSSGMTIPELASFMKAQDCEYALNLDGGSSSTLYMNHKILNHPDADEAEDEDSAAWTSFRPIGDALLIIPKKSGS